MADRAGIYRYNVILFLGSSTGDIDVGFVQADTVEEATQIVASVIYSAANGKFLYTLLQDNYTFAFPVSRIESFRLEVEQFQKPDGAGGQIAMGPVPGFPNRAATEDLKLKVLAGHTATRREPREEADELRREDNEGEHYAG